MKEKLFKIILTLTNAAVAVICVKLSSNEVDIALKLLLAAPCIASLLLFYDFLRKDTVTVRRFILCLAVSLLSLAFPFTITIY